MSTDVSISSPGHLFNQSVYDSMVPQLYGIKAINDRVYVNENGIQVIQTGVPAVLILFGYMVWGLNVTLTKKKADYSDDCSTFSHSSAVLSEQISKGIAKVQIQLTEPGEYYVCFLQNKIDENQTSSLKWIHQGSGYDVTLKVADRLMPVPIQISLIVLCLVLSGTFSGLNLGLMSLDLNEIKVIIRCGTDSEKQYAKIIEPIRKKGNYLLCSILFGNVLVNSSLTILMDDLTSGFIAVIISTLSIVIFGEIVPQAICSRHGLAVGAKTIYLTKLFMLLTFPLSLFISKILDRALGEEIGHVYDRVRLMEYIRVTKTHNELEDDEMAIISGALCLKSKTAEDVMTRLEDAFMLPITSILDFNTVSEISTKGYSRIPVYDSEPKNIVALLHSKDLTFVDPDDKKPLKTIIEFYNHPLIHTDADERLNNVLNHFKNGKSHLAFVRKLFDPVDEDPYYEIIGLVTLEDVIEEILQIEIIDETDILTDNRKKQKRKDTQNIQDFTEFAKMGDSELGTHTISPQLALATFQYLSTAIEPFDRKFITENILRRLIGQKVYYSIEIGHLEERIYTTSSTMTTSEDDSKFLYKFGKPADYFIMILEGKVKVIVGQEKLTYESGPFTYFGVSALKPPVLATKMLLSGSSIGSISGVKSLDASFNQPYQLNSISDRPTSPESTPLLQNHPLNPAISSRPESPEIFKSHSFNSELLHQSSQYLEGNSFIPDFTVKPIEKTLYMKIPRKVYLAAFRASLMDRKDEFLESDLVLFSEEIDNIFYDHLSANKITNSSNKTKRSSIDIIKEKKYSITGNAAQMKFSGQDKLNLSIQKSYECNPIISQSISSQIQNTDSFNKQRRQSLHTIETNNKSSLQQASFKMQSPKTFRKYMKHQNTVPLSTNLATLTTNNNNSYTTINRQKLDNLTNTSLTQIITNPPQQSSQLENVVIIDGTKDVNKTKY